MYHQYFGLNEAPFSIAVNPRYLFMSARHRDALAHLLYGVGAGGGFILLTGEVGTGKTTINRCLLEQLPHDTDIAIILNPALNAMELLATACDEFGIGYDVDKHTLKTLTDSLHKFLLDNHGRGRKTVLMIDEAQHLDFDVLEQIRLLTNLETNSEKLLQIILIGQPELAQLLARPELRQLNQRITARYNLEPLNQSETGAYIHHRLQVAGMTPDREIFPPGVVRAIYRRTRGIPRLINVLCDRMLLGAYGRNKSKADMAMLRVAAKEVMGEDSGERTNLRFIPWAVAVILLVGVAWWWTQQSRAPIVVTAPLAEPPALVAQKQTAGSQVEPPQPLEETVTDAPPPEDLPATWLLPPADARELLWGYSAPGPLPGIWCDPAGPIACLSAQASTWDELAAIDRPLLLELVTAERFAAAAVMLGIEGRQAWLDTADGPTLVDLAELAPLWDGKYLFLWRVPTGFDKPLAKGDRNPVVAEVALLFAQLDGQEQALAGETFNEALKKRIVFFQQAHGLEADGVVGAQTLLKLNEALELDARASAVLRDHSLETSGMGE
jgi:general secretion pathway protein A